MLYRTVLIQRLMLVAQSAAGEVAHGLAVPNQFVFVNHEAIQTHWSPGVDFAGADADLGAKAIAETIAEAGGAVPEDIGGIYQGHEGLGGGF